MNEASTTEGEGPRITTPRPPRGKKREIGGFAAIVILALLIVSLPIGVLRFVVPAPFAEPEWRVRSLVFLRTGPSQRTPATRLLQPGTELFVQSPNLENGYYRVKTVDGTEGWSYATNLHAQTRPLSNAEALGIFLWMLVVTVAGVAVGYLCFAQTPWFALRHSRFDANLVANANGATLAPQMAVALEEYKTLRVESQQTSVNMFTAMQLGGALVGIILASGFTQWATAPLASASAFFVLAPLTCSIVWIVWVGEALRFARVGVYLRTVETAINSAFAGNTSPAGQSKDGAPNPLLWEKWLAEGGHLSSVYFMRLFVFLIISAVSVSMGFAGATQTWSRDITTGPGFVRVLGLAWLVMGALAGTGLQWIGFMFGTTGLGPRPDPVTPGNPDAVAVD